jgi:short-subunit dehydrogenase
MKRQSAMERLLYPPVRLDRVRLAGALNGKTILITGASSGIGKSLALMLADLPVSLVLVARRADKLREVQAEVARRGVEASIYPADLRNTVELEGLIAYLHSLPGGLDVLVSNAGLSIRRSVFQSLDRFHDVTRTTAINYLAPVQLILAMIPLLAKSQGQILNVSTVNALLTPVPYWAAYQGSKSALDHWLRAAAPELRAHGIAVASVYLPLVRTPMIEPTPGYRDLPAMSAEQAAQVIARLFYTRRRVYKPWWLIFGQWASLLFGGIWERRITGKLRREAAISGQPRDGDDGKEGRR